MLMPEEYRPPVLPSDEIASVLNRAVELMPHGALVFDERGTVVAANRRSSAIFGYAHDELLEQPVQRLLAEASRPSRANLGRDTCRALNAGIRKDGAPLPLEIGYSVVNEGESRYVVASVVDISEQVDLETGLLTAQEECLNFERLVGDLITDLVGTNPEKLDAAIVNGLRLIAEALRLDAAVVWRKTSARANLVPTHFWVRRPAPEPTYAISPASMPWVVSQLEAGKAVSFARLSDVPHDLDHETFGQLGLISAAIFPLPVVASAHHGLTAVAFGSCSAEREWSQALVDRLQLAGAVLGQALGRCEIEVALRKALREVRQLSAGLGGEHDRLGREGKPIAQADSIVLKSAAVKRAFSQAESVAPMPATVLLLGDTGCGKEVFAQAIHDLSPRRHRPMVRLNCAAIPSTLIESELFGRERGAFTGALSRQIGRFEAANLSTLFLDEIGELPLEVQVKLLRVIQERVVERLGSNQPVKVDVRIIAATNRNLEKAVEDHAFREDLYYRLNVFPIVVPPLRERVDDIPDLVWTFVDDFSKMFGKPIDTISKASMQELERYTWPGNVRELRNVIERAMIVCTGRHLQVSVPKPAAPKLESTTILADLENAHIRTVLESTNWRVRGGGGAAERLGLKPTTLESRMAKLGIRRTTVRKPTQPSECEAEVLG
jgi:formate hydrogenlyase transcriptional activator